MSEICDRFNVSDRAGAAIATAALQDAGIITEDDTSLVIDRSKLRRQRTRRRKGASNQHKQYAASIGLYFDGRKDSTIAMTKIGYKYYRRKLLEEHVCLAKEPGSEYMGHVCPLSSSSDNISTSIWEFMGRNSETSIEAIGCDGTVVNTGCKNGVIRLLEGRLNKPLQWLICLLHSNELPLSHLVQHLDGRTYGPTQFAGPIGKALKHCQELPVVAFKKIACDILTVTNEDLSTDQQYLLDIYNSRPYNAIRN